MVRLGWRRLSQMSRIWQGSCLQIAGGRMSRALVSRLFLLILLVVAVSGCEVVGGIFKAGMWVGIIMAVLVVALLMWVFSRARS